MTAPAQDVRALLDRLEQAHAAATPGPWFATRNDVWPGPIICENHWPGLPEGHPHLDPGEPAGPPHYVTAQTYGPRDDADAAAIVAAVNALPSLVSALRAVADLADEWLRPAGYTSHYRDGLRDAARQIRSALTAALSPTEVRP